MPRRVRHPWPGALRVSGPARLCRCLDDAASLVHSPGSLWFTQGSRVDTAHSIIMSRLPRAVFTMMPRTVCMMMPRAVFMMVVHLDDDAASLVHPFTLVFAVMPLVWDSYGMCVPIHGVFVHADTPVCTDVRRVSDIRGVY
jgi:hypothetical protein